ncbi:MutS-related protein [Roseivirga pacifica]|uniref:MutS-related protein n=1 Tax=Roseivirga pacifica TaxID=1267423 RepID=UPI00227C0938|nr:hypothetical protein [Roseivirga pacifica]
MNSSNEIFEKRKSQFQSESKSLKTKSTNIAWFRVAVFVAGLIGIVWFANKGLIEAVTIVTVALLVAYVALLKHHNRVKTKLKLYEALAQVNEEELLRATNQLKALKTGDTFYDAQHPYHEDLDVFGRHSLFQLLNRSATTEGEALLANWLSNPAGIAMVNERQSAVKELAGLLDFRQYFEAYGKAAEKEAGSKEPFINWLQQEEHLKGKLVYQVLLAVVPLSILSTIVLAYMGIVQTGLPILLCFVSIGILGTVFNRIMEITKQTENGYKSLQSLKEHLVLVEQQQFKSQSLQNLRHQLIAEERKASKTLSELKFILDSMQNRANFLYAIFDMILLLDVFWLLKILKWKQDNRIDIAAWYATIAQFDALNSLAGFAYANPSFAYPELVDQPFYIETKEMGHPLIDGKKRVSNDFLFKGKGGICLITGSNMSGKSTFLRTLGVNVILAQIGAPVCATKMKLGPTDVFTSMRTKDELEESVSSFYAELKRLKKLLAYINSEKPTLFMIDEVLKGTNSEDRHKGAIALVKQLNKAYAFGLVSTHDIVLGNLTNELQGVKNYSFNSQIVADEIIFDYTLTDGICQSFNATKLMQKMGIEISE